MNVHKDIRAAYIFSFIPFQPSSAQFAAASAAAGVINKRYNSNKDYSKYGIFKDIFEQEHKNREYRIQNTE